MEIQRVGKNQFICAESYKNEKQLFNLQCWALTCSLFSLKKNGSGFSKIRDILEITIYLF